MLIVGSISIETLVADGNIWITKRLGLTDFEGVVRRINGKKGIEWSY
jgi:hypothetical protein